MQEGSRLSSLFGTIGTTPAKCLGYFHLSIKRALDEIAQPSIFNSPPSMINKLPLSAGHRCQAPGARNLDLLALADSLRVFHQRAKKKAWSSPRLFVQPIARTKYLALLEARTI
jgi:hypothetical protein